MDVRPLTVETWDALAALFEEGGDPKRCWCMFWRLRGLDWTTFTASRNRRALRELTERAEQPPGLVALDDDGRAIGWVSVGPREDYARLVHSRVLAPVDERPVWSIVCFVVARRARGRGVARTLLEAAMDHAAENGATLVEAYPVDTGGARVAAASAYTGTRGMYEAAGFELTATRQAPGAKRARPILRRRVRRRRATGVPGA